MKTATRRQIEAARSTLLTVFETEGLTGQDRDKISYVRFLLDLILDERGS